MKNFENVSQYFTANTPDDLKQIISDAIETQQNDKQLIKKELLKQAAKKDPHYFKQIDGLAGCDCVEGCGHDEDEIYGTDTWELKNCTNEVRVLIHEDAKPEAVIRLLKRITEWVENDQSLITGKDGRNKLLNIIKNPDPCTARPNIDCAQAFADGASGNGKTYTGNVPF
jgi:hypothetical protein